MSAVELADVNLQDVPPRIRAKVRREAKSMDVSVSYLVAKITAESLNLDMEPPRGRYAGGGTGPTMVVSLPVPLRHVLRMEAAERGATIRGIVLNAVAQRYALPAVNEARRPRSQRRRA